MNGSLAALSDRDTVRVQTAANTSTFAGGSFGSSLIDFILTDDWPPIVTLSLTNAVANVPEQLQADWKLTVDNLIGELATLGPNWDSYGAPPIDLTVIADAKILVSRLAKPGVLTPSVVPTVNGTVQLEWHTRAFDAEVEIIAPRQYYLFTRPIGGQSWEGETTLNEAVHRLQRLLGR